MIKTFNDNKDPNSTLDYQVDWSFWLAGDTIAASTWTIGQPLSQVSASYTASTTTIWLAGGKLRTSIVAINHIVTADGREEDATITFFIADKF